MNENHDHVHTSIVATSTALHPRTPLALHLVYTLGRQIKNRSYRSFDRHHRHVIVHRALETGLTCGEVGRRPASSRFWECMHRGVSLFPVLQSLFASGSFDTWRNKHVDSRHCEHKCSNNYREDDTEVTESTRRAETPGPTGHGCVSA